MGECKMSGSIVTLFLKAVTLAMGVAVVVLSVLNRLDPNTGLILLGIGLTSGGIALLRRQGG